MRNKQSLITWGTIFVLLVASGLLTIIVPALFSGQASTPLPSDPSTVTINLPVPINGQSSVTLPSWLLMLGLALLVIGLVVGAGLTLGLVSILFSRLVSRTQDDPEFQTRAAALEQKETQRVKSMRLERPTSVSPDVRWQRWAVFTTGASILMFVAFLGYLLSGILLPEGQVVRNDAIVNLANLFVVISLAIALVVLLFTLRRERIAAVDDTATLSIPWNFIAVLLSGLLIVGLGIGVLALINTP